MGREEGGRKMRGAGRGALNSTGDDAQFGLDIKEQFAQQTDIITNTLRVPRPTLALQNMTGRCCVSLNIVCCLITSSRPW